MNKSESIKEIAKALVKFQTKVNAITKDASNPFFKSSYASLANILEEISLPLIESGLAVSQFPSGDNCLTTILMHGESGEFIESEYVMHPVKNDPQSQGSAISYMRRYAISAVLQLRIEDDDANTATYGAKTPEQAIDNGKIWLNKTTKDGHITDDWNKVTTALKDGKATIALVESKFKLSKVIKSELLTLVNGTVYEPA